MSQIDNGSIDNGSIAEKTKQLGHLVEWFSSSDFELEAAFTKFAEAEKLANDIEKDLATMKNKITILKAKFDESE